jgi:Tfp pilus assembly PilM family ATPase
MFGADNTYLTVSINDGVIKMAQAGPSGNIEKVARGSYPATATAEQAAKSVKSLLSSFKRDIPAMCLLPASAATAKLIEVPSSDPDEIKSIINLQASRHTPYAREEVLISYINLGMTVANNTRLLLVIVHRDVVRDRIGILQKAGLDVDRIVFIPEAQARFYSKALNLKKEAPPLGIVDFAMNTTSYMVLSKGTLLFVRHIPIGLKALKQGDDAPAKLLEEFKKSMEAFTQEDGNEAPKTYLVTTAHKAVVQILPALKEGQGLEFEVNAFLNFIKCPADVRKKLQEDFDDDSFLDVAAPAASGVKCEIDLMPEEMLLKKTVDRQSREVSKAGAAAVIIMVLLGVMIMTNIYFKDTYLNKNLIARFASQKAQVRTLAAQMNKAKLVRGYITQRMVSLDIIHELYAITPRKIYLSNIAVANDGTVVIDGTSDSMSSVFSYVKSLDDSDMFKEAKTKSTSVKKENGNDVAAFEIEFKLNAAKETA